MKMAFAMIAAFLLTVAGTAGLCSGGTAFSLQVAASMEKGAAEETAEQMNRMGYDAFVRLETVPGKGQWYRVYVERFGSKAQADKEAAALKSLGLLNECYVRALKDETEPKPLPIEQKAPPREEKTRVEKATLSPGRLHFLHVGSFIEKENADKEVAGLLKKGQKAFLMEEQIAGKRWYRAYIGEFADLMEALKAGNMLKEKGVISYFKVISLSKEGHKGGKSPNHVATRR